MREPAIVLAFGDGERTSEAVRLECPGGARLVLGNRKSASIPLRDPWISWDHAAFFWKGGHVWVEDMGSANGTYVNRERISRRKLAIGDEIWFGKTPATIRLAEDVGSVSVVDPGPADHRARSQEAGSAGRPRSVLDALAAGPPRVHSPTWTLVCEPYLDTDEPQRVAQATAELRRRGYPSPVIFLMRAFALGGCWWNALWWEEEAGSLGWREIGIGWVLNFLFAFPAALLVIVLVRFEWLEHVRRDPSPLAHALSGLGVPFAVDGALAIVGLVFLALTGPRQQ